MGNNKKNNTTFVKPSKLFMKLFLIPYICWFVISLLTMIPDATETDQVTWGELLLFNTFILIIWFIISFIISQVVTKFKKNNSKTKVIKENQFIIDIKRKIYIVIKAILLIFWIIFVLSITNSFKGIIFPFVLLVFGALIILNFELLKRIKEQKNVNGYLHKEFKILRIVLIIFNILIFSIFWVVLDKTSDIDKHKFKKYMDKNVCVVNKDKKTFIESKNYIKDSYITDNEKCDFLIGYVSFENGNEIIFNEIIDKFKNGYNLKRDSFYQSAGGEKEVTMNGIFFDKKYNFIIFMKSNTIVYSLYKEGYNNQVKKIMSDLGYTEKHTFKSLLVN